MLNPASKKIGTGIHTADCGVSLLKLFLSYLIRIMDVDTFLVFLYYVLSNSITPESCLHYQELTAVTSPQPDFNFKHLLGETDEDQPSECSSWIRLLA